MIKLLSGFYRMTARRRFKQKYDGIISHNTKIKIRISILIIEKHRFVKVRIIILLILLPSLGTRLKLYAVFYLRVFNVIYNIDFFFIA